MKHMTRPLIVAAVVCVALLQPRAASAQPAVPGPCLQDGLPGGALSLLCVPSAGWNGQLVVFAHGYVAPGLPLDFYNLTLADGASIPVLVQSLGFAFATTSFRQNGLAVLEGVEDLRNLVAQFVDKYSQPLRTYVVGASEGGLVSVLSAERSPDLFFGALATCGPIGSFQGQIDYVADFRVLFDYFFPGVVPGPAIDIPASVMASWYTVYAPAVLAALAENPAAALQLMRVSHAAFDPSIPATIANTTLDILWYNVFATNDAVEKLGGSPYSNRFKLYLGSANDLRLNLLVRRYTASPAARLAVRAYETSGELPIPLVTLHTTGDDVTPFGHEWLYRAKVDPVARGRFWPLPVVRYGHCNVTAAEVLTAFQLMARQP